MIFDSRDKGLVPFVTESNAIEGIFRDPTPEEIGAHVQFLELDEVTVADLEEFVKICAGAPLRRRAGMDVRVGNHLPPRGGEHIELQLRALLNDVNPSSYELHGAYETLHPFMDGNGRSGRALWAWHMFRHGRDPFARPFLQTWYYDSLQDCR